MAIINFSGFDGIGYLDAGQENGLSQTPYVSYIKRPNTYRSLPPPGVPENEPKYYDFVQLTSAGRSWQLYNMSIAYVTLWVYIIKWDPHGAYAINGNEGKIMEFNDLTPSYQYTKLLVTIRNDRIMKVYNQAGTLIQTFTNAIPLNQWVRLDFKCGTGTSGAWEVRLNINTEVHNGTTDLNTVNIGHLNLGWYYSIYTGDYGDYNFYMDDPVVDSAQYAPDAYSVIACWPRANGYWNQIKSYNNQWQGEEWKALHEWKYPTNPYYDPNKTNGLWLLLSDGTQVTTVPMDQLPSVFNGTIYAVKAGIEVYGDDLTAPGTSAWLRVRTHNTDYDLSAQTWPVGSYTSRVRLYRVMPTNPNTGSAWTIDEVNNVEVGCKINTPANNRYSCFETAHIQVMTSTMPQWQKFMPQGLWQQMVK